MATATQELKRHPIRGVLWGLLFGLGIAMVLIDRAVIAFGTLPPILIVLLFGVLGGVFGAFAPPTGPKSAPPARQEAPAAAASTAASAEPSSPPTEPETSAEAASGEAGTAADEDELPTDRPSHDDF